MTEIEVAGLPRKGAFMAPFSLLTAPLAHTEPGKQHPFGRSRSAGTAAVRESGRPNLTRRQKPRFLPAQNSATELIPAKAAQPTFAQ
jgi:hypothetical protein